MAEDHRRVSEEESTSVKLRRTNLHPSLFEDEEIRSFLSPQASEVSTGNRDSSELARGDASSFLSVPTSHGAREGGSRLETQTSHQTKTVESHEKESHNGIRSAERKAWTSWLFEILSFLAGALSLVAIFVILGEYNGERQPQWPYTINLSTLVALLATALRSMLMQVLESVIGQLKWAGYRPGSARPLSHIEVLDEATRGPWGSAKLLFSIPRWNWATFGAVITIVSVGIGAFTQQSLRTFPCAKPLLVQEASIPTAQSTNSGFVTLLNPGSANQLKLLDTGMKGALIAGLAQTTATIPVNCPSGNCTFPAFDGITHTTVGFNSYCVDAESSLRQTGSVSWSKPTRYGQNGTQWTNYSISSSSLNTEGIGYTLESYPTFRHLGRWHPTVGVYPVYVDSSRLSEEDQLIANNSAVSFSILVPTASPCQEGRMASYVYQADYNDVDPDFPVNTSACPQLGMTNATSFPGAFSVMAAVCYFYPSLRQYWGTISNGQLHERPIGDPIPLTRVSGDIYGDWFNLSYVGLVEPCVINGTVYSSSNYSTAPGDLVSITFDDNGVNKTLGSAPLQCFYGLPELWDQALSDTLGSQISSPEEGDCYVTANYSDIVCTDKWWLSSLYNGRNASLDSISQFMDGIADSLTAQLRRIGTDWDGNPSSVSGMAFQTDVCTQFVWEWLIFPTAIAVGAAVLLATVVLSSWDGVRAGRPWKTSTLPLLLYGLSRHQGTYTDADEVLSQEELKNVARNMKVDFSLGDDGWRFRAAE